jgi:hypothetical protein
LRRLREDQQRMAMAQRGRGGMMQRGAPMRGGMIRGRGGVMLSRGGIKRPLQGHTGPRPSFQYRDGSFICDLCKKSFSDGNDMVSTFCLKSCLGPKKQGIWPRINCSQMKLPNFMSPSADSSS